MTDTGLPVEESTRAELCFELSFRVRLSGEGGGRGSGDRCSREE